MAAVTFTGASISRTQRITEGFSLSHAEAAPASGGITAGGIVRADEITTRRIVTAGDCIGLTAVSLPGTGTQRTTKGFRLGHAGAAPASGGITAGRIVGADEITTGRIVASGRCLGLTAVSFPGAGTQRTTQGFRLGHTGTVPTGSRITAGRIVGADDVTAGGIVTPSISGGLATIAGAGAVRG